MFGLCYLDGLYSLKSPISPKNFLILIVGSSLAPKWPISNHLIKSLLKHTYECSWSKWPYIFDSGILTLDFKDFDQNSSVFQSENLMTTEFLWNSRKLLEKFNQYSNQKIRWPQNSYEILEKVWIYLKYLRARIVRKPFRACLRRAPNFEFM